MPRRLCIKDTPRSSDVRVLRALDMRLAGMTWDQIALELNCGNRGAMKELCLRVQTADRKESGEPESEVARWYR